MKPSLQPSRTLLGLLGVWTVLGLLPAFWPSLTIAWLVLGGLALFIALQDALWHKPALTAQRQVAPILPVGVWSPVHVRLDNLQQRHWRVIVFDHYPQPADFDDLPRTLELASKGWAEFEYRLQPLERGDMHFGPIQVLIDSPLKLWQRSLHLGPAEPEPIKVYPNFATIAKFTLLISDSRIAAMGIHQRRRRGEGQDFHQLREYRQGDTLRQVDWKATARHRKLISKEYQDERDQPLLFLLDCSRRMRARDGELSHFDHALNAMILLSYVALRQGDAVGIQSFGGPRRQLAARNGQRVLNDIINTVYDLQPTLRPPDYGRATQELLVQQRKRALVIVLTNLRDDDDSDLQPAVRLLHRRHLVLIANLRETILDTALSETVNDFKQARQYAAVCHYLACAGT